MRCVWTGLLSAALAFLWQALIVHTQYQGNWTALFCTGARLEQPAALAEEGIYTFPNSSGYDGQFYHYMAHDPFLGSGMARYIDMPELRYRRILVPLAAYALALGRARFVDDAYIAVLAICVFLGSYWLSAFFCLHGFDARWGLTFLLIPGVSISIDRLTVDAGLMALSVAFALYFARDAQPALYATLMASPLVRETGLLLLASYVAYLLIKRRWRQALLFGTAVIPAAAWYWFVALHTAPIQGSRWFSPIPLAPLARRLMEPVAYSLAPAAALAATVLDYVALLGMILAIGIAYSMVRRLKEGPVEISLLLFGLLASFLAGPHGWMNSYDFARSLGPLLLLAALVGVGRRKWLYVVPQLLVLPRIFLQSAPHAVAILRCVRTWLYT